MISTEIFAGEDINLDALFTRIGPDANNRAQNIAADPYAAANFFHFLIRAVFECLFGIQTSKFQVKN